MSDTKTKPEMTLPALGHAVNLALDSLKLGPRSYHRSSAYHDYVAMGFTLFNPTQEETMRIYGIFRTLCDRHGWTVCTVTRLEKAREIMVTLSASNVISTCGVRRMPM